SEITTYSVNFTCTEYVSVRTYRIGRLPSQLNFTAQTIRSTFRHSLCGRIVDTGQMNLDVGSAHTEMLLYLYTRVECFTSSTLASSRGTPVLAIRSNGRR